MGAIITAEPIAALEAGDLVPFAKRGERRPLLRKVTGVKRERQFRTETNVWDTMVSVTIGIHPRQHSAKAGVDIVTGWASDGDIDVVVGWDE